MIKLLLLTNANNCIAIYYTACKLRGCLRVGTLQKVAVVVVVAVVAEVVVVVVVAAVVVAVV